MSNILNIEKFYLIGNNLSLDFINTKIAASGQAIDLLADFTDLLSWSVAAKLLSKSQAEKMFLNWKNRAEAKAAHVEAINFRSVLHEMFIRRANGKSVGKKALDSINREIQNISGTTEIRRTANGFEKFFRADFQEPRQLLAPVAESAADLLCYGDPKLLKKCENPECVLYFYDTSKNHTRRWCSMAACGNRAKAAAFYARRKQLTEIA